MGFDVALIAADGTELIQIGFYSIDKARDFAKAAVSGKTVKQAIILSFGDKYEAYAIGDDGKPEWFIF